MALDLKETKNFLRVDHELDDGLINMFIRSAQSFVETYLNQKLTDFGENYPAEFDVAMLQIIAQWYEVRSIMSPRSNVKELPFVFSDLLDPHRKWQFAFLGDYNSMKDGMIMQDGIDGMKLDKATGLFYRADIVDTYTVLTDDTDLSHAPDERLIAPIENVDYNQKVQRGEE